MEDPTGTEKAQLICVNSRGRWSCHLISPAGAANVAVRHSAAQHMQLSSVKESSAKLGQVRLQPRLVATPCSQTSSGHLNASGEGDQPPYWYHSIPVIPLCWLNNAGTHAALPYKQGSEHAQAVLHMFEPWTCPCMLCNKKPLQGTNWVFNSHCSPALMLGHSGKDPCCLSLCIAMPPRH